MPDEIIGYVDDHGNVTYEQIRAAMNGKPYTFQAVGADGQAVLMAVNQGIDAHLEACFVQGRDSYKPFQRTLPPSERLPKGGVLAVGIEASVSPESLPVLLRRLLELHRYADSETGDAAESFACAIVDQLLSPDEDDDA